MKKSLLVALIIAGSLTLTPTTFASTQTTANTNAVPKNLPAMHQISAKKAKKLAKRFLGKKVASRMIHRANPSNVKQHPIDYGKSPKLS